MYLNMFQELKDVFQEHKNMFLNMFQERKT